MFARYLNFMRAVSVNWIGKTGVILTTSGFVTFAVFELARLTGILTNSYVGLITYLLLPGLFILGLILIPIGWRRRKKQTGLTTRELLEHRFDKNELKGGLLGSRLFILIGTLTLVNVLFLSAAGSRMFHFMDEPRFCGTACHSVMNPEWITYQQSPHAHVKCVDCHVGEGADALVDSKLNGIWQMISITFDLLERPIPTPVHNLRPARETCEKCHWPDKFYGNRIKRILGYQDDKSSTPSYTTLALKIDAGSAGATGGIHWHVAEANEVRYASLDDKREEMIWVEVRQKDGSYKRFNNRYLEGMSHAQNDVRTLDCIDCHNRATHIYELPGEALDQRISRGLIDRSLPFIKREALEALTANYADRRAAMDGIANQLTAFYGREFQSFAQSHTREIDSAVSVLQSVYDRNIHHGMNITWGTYRSHVGHRNDQGCFRCHNEGLIDEDGTGISVDCTSCHSILAYDSESPFHYLNPPDTSDIDFEMHDYLRQEFMRATGY